MWGGVEGSSRVPTVTATKGPACSRFTTWVPHVAQKQVDHVPEVLSHVGPQLAAGELKLPAAHRDGHRFATGDVLAVAAVAERQHLRLGRQLNATSRTDTVLTASPRFPGPRA